VVVSASVGQVKSVLSRNRQVLGSVAAMFGGNISASLLGALGGLLVVNAVLLALALGITIFTSKKLGFSRADQITIIFCGSKKSLAAGVPMAKVIFASNAVGAVVLPLMLFHQIQLMVCAALAQRWGARDMSAERAASAGDESRAGASEHATAARR